MDGCNNYDISSLPEIAAPKKELLCQSCYSEEVWRSIFSENKAVLEKLQHVPEGKSAFEKKSQIRLVIKFNWICFPRDVPSAW